MVAYDYNERWSVWLHRYRQWNGLALITGGNIVLLGWFLDSNVLKRIIPGFVAMNPVTALGFILAGISLAFYWEGHESTKKLRFGRIPAALLTGIGALKLAEYLFGWHLAFDQILFSAQMKVDSPGFKNQIAPNTAFNFVLGGLALWFLNGSPRKFFKSAQFLGLTLMVFSLAPLIRYLYKATFLYSVGSSIPMALHTALLFFLFAGGVLMAQSDDGVVALFMSQTPGGAFARGLLPFAFAVPVALGAPQIAGARKGLYPNEFDVGLMVAGCIGTFVSLIWRAAIVLNRADDRRQVAEERLQREHDELERRVKERTSELFQSNETLRSQIADLEKAEDRIREQADLLNKTKDAIMVLDIQGRISFWSKGAEALYGWNPEEAGSKNIRALLFKDEALASDIFEKVRKAGAWSGELEQETKGDKKVCVESRWTLVTDGEGRSKSILLIDTDVTDKKQLEAQILRSQRMDGIGALAGGIAHDLNNALAPVLISAEMLKERPGPKDQEKFLDIITSSSQRGIQMVKQILTFVRGTRAESGPVPASQLVQEMATVIQSTFPKSISVCVKAPAKQPSKINGDVTELHQVLLNLCLNARDAMPNGGQLTLAVENVRLEGANIPYRGKAGPHVLISVSDTGTGIPPEVLPRIFEPFYTTKKSETSSGLGLSTVAGIVKHWGGFLDIKTAPGKGTEFRVFLPALEATETVEAKTAPTPPPAGHGELILVMDDEDVMRELTKTTLENYGYRVVTALNGLHGIARFEELKDEIKLVVTDSDMPYLDGLSAVCSMQQLRPNIPVIIASGTKHDAQRMQQLDPTNLVNLGKPYEVRELLASVARMISLH